MLKGIDPNERVEFISSYDNSEPKTVFILRPLTGMEMSGGLSSKEDIFRMVSVSVVEIKNMPEGQSKEDFIKSLPLLPLGELVQKCNELNKITGQDAKNS